MDGAINFDQLFRQRLELMRRENRYRTFADLERRAGHFARVFDHRLQDQVTPPQHSDREHRSPGRWLARSGARARAASRRLRPGSGSLCRLRSPARAGARNCEIPGGRTSGLSTRLCARTLAEFRVNSSLGIRVGRCRAVTPRCQRIGDNGERYPCTD